MAIRKGEKTNPTGKTTTRTEMRERLDMTANLLATNLDEREVRAQLIKLYDVSRNAASGYIRRVLDEWEDDSKEYRRFEKTKQIKRLHNIATQAMGRKIDGKAAPDLDAALKAEALLMKVLGTSAPEKLSITLEQLEGLTDEQLARIAQGEDPALVIGSPDAVH